MEVIDWEPELDEDLLPGELNLHSELHAIQARKSRSYEQLLRPQKRRRRIKAFTRGLRRTRKRFQGTILEVGAGDGWMSAYLLKEFAEIQLDVLEIDAPAVEQLIPKTLSLAGSPVDSVRLIRGSFNTIPLKNHYDFVVAMGVLHHSSNLFKSMRQLCRCLKPNGWLIAQEPAVADDTSNALFWQRQDESAMVGGVVTCRNKIRTDLFYRRCEYLTAAYHSGFDVHIESLRSWNSWWTTSPPAKLDPKDVLIVAQKPGESPKDLPPTAWEH